MKEYIVNLADISEYGRRMIIGNGIPKEELIRCKDCKHNRDGICGWHYGVSPVDGYRWVVDDDDFCSCGERR